MIVKTKHNMEGTDGGPGLEIKKEYQLRSDKNSPGAPFTNKV